MIETFSNLNPHEVIKSEQLRHSSEKKRNITRIRKNYRKEDIEIIAKHFPNIKSVLCVGCRDDSEVKDFMKNGVGCIGIDVSNETKYIKRIDAHKLNEHFSNVDLVYTSHSLEHMVNSSKVLCNIRKLNPKGVYVVLPLQEKGPSFKHVTKFELMHIDNQNNSIDLIINQKKCMFKNPEKYPEIWNDFKELKPFKILEWKIRQGLESREKEILFLLEIL